MAVDIAASPAATSRRERQQHKRMQRHIDTLQQEADPANDRAFQRLLLHYSYLAEAPLMELSETGPLLTRCRAVMALSKLKSSNAFRAIHSRLTDPAPEVRYDAAMALGELADLRALPILAEVMSVPDPEDSVDSAAAAAFCEFGSAALPFLIPLLEASDPITQGMAIRCVGSIHDLASLPHLQPFLQDPDEHVRAEAIEALAEFENLEAAALGAGKTTTSPRYERRGSA